MGVRASSVLLCTLGCALLAGCGSNSPAAVPPTPAPHKTADVAANENGRATAVAVANATSVAVQHVAQTAVAKLQSTANTQTHNVAAANTAATASARAAAYRATHPTTTSPPPPPVVRVPPTATPSPVNHPAHRSKKRPAAHTGLVALASITCCRKGEFKNAAEKTSKSFSVNGAWLLRWSTNCANLTNGRQPIMYIAVVPAGSKNPIQFIQEPMPTSSPGSGLATENLHGRYYLDVMSACRHFGAIAYGRRGAYVSAGVQAAALREAKGKDKGAALTAVRASLLGRSNSTSKSHANARARARALARARSLYVADLSAILSQVQAARQTLSTASGAITSTSSDFDPTILKASKDYANAATQELQAAGKQLQRVKTLPQHGKLKTIIKNAIGQLSTAAVLVLQATDDIGAGNSDTATASLTSATTKIDKAKRQIKHAARNLQILKAIK